MSYGGLCVGVFLLLCSLQMYININSLIREKNIRKNGFDYISVTKTVTNENMGQDNRFTPADVQDIKRQNFITDAAPLVSNEFRAKASAGSIIPFSTDLFLEAIQNDFIDTVPPSFTWRQGQQELPIIFSADFLEMYNVFAPAQGLPQLSAASVGAVNIIVECYGPLGIKTTYQGHIVAVTDRINSILVPISFLEWANKSLGSGTPQAAARVYLKTKDANSVDLLNYLESKNYHVNKDKTKFGRVKQVLQGIVAGLGGFAVLVIVLAIMLFSFYLQLMIARSKDNLQLLITLGYAPGWLSSTVSKKWIPAYIIIVLIAVAACQLVQILFWQFLISSRQNLSMFISPYTVFLAALVLCMCVYVNYAVLKKSVLKL